MPAMRLLPVLVLLPLVACGGGARAAKPAADAPAAPAKIEVQEAAKPQPATTLDERLAAVAPGERPSDPPYDRVLPGMPADEIAKLLGRPDAVRERGVEATAHWRTGGPRDPVYIVWLRDGVATRMRFADRW